jgi:hypothetical protein
MVVRQLIELVARGIANRDPRRNRRFDDVAQRSRRARFARDQHLVRHTGVNGLEDGSSSRDDDLVG